MLGVFKRLREKRSKWAIRALLIVALFHSVKSLNPLLSKYMWSQTLSPSTRGAERLLIVSSVLGSGDMTVNR